ncbi:MAG TPA: NAD(P)-dependent oxidoreductase [Ramlibacter sp.]|nr:NAD(P)-dependent oxidoreductase [Ramlibacter sp.]
MRVLITGAAGHMATLALPGLEGRHTLRLADRREPARLPAGATFHRSSLLDVTDSGLADLFGDVDAVIHSAYIPSAERDVYSVSPPQHERFEAELDNIRMAQRVYGAAFKAGVQRVVIVSSNHAADWYEHAQVHNLARELVYPTDLPLSDNFYGWSKASYELLAYPYACGTFGRQMEMVMLRIGSPYPIDVSRFEPGQPAAVSGLPRPSGAAAFKRALGAWLSDRDCAALFRCALEAPLDLPANAVPWTVAYGISDNTRAFWSLESARRVLGYAPQDDSEAVYADAVRRWLTERQPACGGRLGPPVVSSSSTQP